MATETSAETSAPSAAWRKWLLAVIMPVFTIAVIGWVSWISQRAMLGPRFTSQDANAMKDQLSSDIREVENHLSEEIRDLEARLLKAMDDHDDIPWHREQGEITKSINSELERLREIASRTELAIVEFRAEVAAARDD